MDFNDKVQVDKLFEQLLLVADKLVCNFCDKNLVDPVGLKCVHRFCSKCIRDHKNKNENQCPTCKKPVLTDKIRQCEMNIRMYQNSFMKLLKSLEKKIKSSARLNALKDFFQNSKTLSQLKNQFEAPDDQNVLYEVNEKELEENRFIKLNASCVMSDYQNILEETINKSFETMTPPTGSMSVLSVDETVYGIDEKENEPMSNKSSVKRKASQENMDYIDMLNRDSDSDSSDDSMDTSELSKLDSSDSDDELLKDTQSQLPPVKKQRITYVHKKEDHFDRVVKKTEKSIIADKTVARKPRPSSPEMENILELLKSDFSDSSDLSSF